MCRGLDGPLPLPQGQYSRDGIVARIDFGRLNDEKTEMARQRNEAETPPVYLAHTAAWRTLIDELRESLFAILNAKQPADVPADVLISFGLSIDMNGDMGDTSKAWETLKSTLGSTETGEQRIEQMIGEFTKFIEPLRQTGILDPSELALHDLREDAVIHIIPDENPADEQDIAITQVLLKEVLKSTGKLGRSWKSFDLLQPLQPCSNAGWSIELPARWNLMKHARDKPLTKPGCRPRLLSISTSGEHCWLPRGRTSVSKL